MFVQNEARDNGGKLKTYEFKRKRVRKSLKVSRQTSIESLEEVCEEKL